MPKKHYDWTPGEPPPALGRHSIGKHKVLKAYLEKYVATLTHNPAQERLKLTLVDGFSGGGVYRHPDKNELIPGSPLIMLQAMSAASTAANTARRKDFHLDVEYFFIEKLKPTVEYLNAELQDSPEARQYEDRYYVLQGCFSEHLGDILRRVEQRGKSRRVIFVLDQYGFTDIRMADLRRIFKRLPNAEVIMTVAIDWLIDHWTDSEQYNQILANLGLDLETNLISQVKQSHSFDWRAVIQHALHDQFYRNSGAGYYTPFFIRSVDAHRAYWLLHFSGHAKARDVMMQLHWDLENGFQHFGRPGLCMLGFDPSRDTELTGQTMLAFDSQADESTRMALREEIPRWIALADKSFTFKDLFAGVVNETPATKSMLADEICRLELEGELIVRRQDGSERRRGTRVRDDDIICPPRERQKLFLPLMYR